MRAREFLIEYSRAKTAEMVGDKLIQGLVKDRHVPYQLVLAQRQAAVGTGWDVKLSRSTAWGPRPIG